MDDPLVVRRGEPVGDLARVVDGFAWRQRAGLQAASKRFPLEQFGDDVRCAVVDASIVDGEDVRVTELPGRPCFLFETMHSGGIGRKRLGISLIATSRANRESRAR